MQMKDNRTYKQILETLSEHFGKGFTYLLEGMVPLTTPVCDLPQLVDARYSKKVPAIDLFVTVYDSLLDWDYDEVVDKDHDGGMIQVFTSEKVRFTIDTLTDPQLYGYLFELKVDGEWYRIWGTDV